MLFFKFIVQYLNAGYLLSRALNGMNSMFLAVIIIKMQGDNDLMLRYNIYGKQFEAARPGIPVTQVEASHFLPEEAYEVIAAKVEELVPSV